MCGSSPFSVGTTGCINPPGCQSFYPDCAADRDDQQNLPGLLEDSFQKSASNTRLPLLGAGQLHQVAGLVQSVAGRDRAPAP